MEPKKSYERLTPLMCARLAAPHTWPGPAVLTSVFSGLYAIAFHYDFSWVIWCLLLAVAVFAQSAVNTLNDWADYRAGTDTVENSDDPTDAVLVYNNPNPAHVMVLGICYMAVALACGIVCIVWAGSLVPLAIGLVGAVFIVIYSSGKIPISYLPIGEVVSGVVMGCLIPLAGISVFVAHSYPGSGPFDVLWQIDWVQTVLMTGPFVIGIGMVMATQNNCDIERDASIGRHTLPVVLGRKKSVVVYRVFVVLWVATTLHFSFWCFPGGFWACVVTLLLGAGTVYHLLVTPLTHEVRGPAMGTVMKGNLFINGAYLLAMIVACL